MNATSILLRRANTLLVPKQRGEVSAAVVATFNQNLQSLGYTLSPKAIRALRKVDEDAVTALFADTVATLKELRGVRSYRPMYPNFPKQVIQASWAELYLNAVIHYFSVWASDVTKQPGIIWLPKYRKEVREPLVEKVQLTVLEVGTTADLSTMGQRLAASNTSLSASDKDDLKFLIQNHLFELPERIPNKENLAIVGSLLMNDKKVFSLFKTTTDILRLATALSNGDVSLAENTKFISFNRQQRKTLLTLLEHCHALEEDMARWSKRWLRLGERLHPGEHAKQYPRTFAAFATLRSNLPITTFNSQVEAAVREPDVETALELLSTRPGDFARRLDHVLRQARTNSRNGVVGAFAEVSKGASTPVLLQMMSHFEHRNDTDLRVVFPKGNLAKVRAIPTLDRRVSAAVCDSVVTVARDTLIERFSHLPTLGKVYIDPLLKDCLVPFSQRSASKALHTLVRGSKLPFGHDEKDTIRFFVWWKDINPSEKSADDDDYYSDSGRVDLDLSAILFDEDWKYVEHITYYRLRSAQYKAYHSGDITSAPKGASEFIDLDIPSMVKYGGRYVVMNVNSFTRQHFSKIPEVFAGWMLREEPQSGEIFDPRTVEQKIDVTADAAAVMPMVLDVEERKVIWADIPVPTHSALNNVHGQSESITLLGKSMTEVRKPDLYNLFRLHAEARGKQVKTLASADVVFSVAAGTHYELDKIAAEFMPNEVGAKAKV